MFNLSRHLDEFFDPTFRSFLTLGSFCSAYRFLPAPRSTTIGSILFSTLPTPSVLFDALASRHRFNRACHDSQCPEPTQRSVDADEQAPFRSRNRNEGCSFAVLRYPIISLSSPIPPHLDVLYLASHTRHSTWTSRRHLWRFAFG